MQAQAAEGTSLTIFILVLLIAIPLLGNYMANVLDGKFLWMERIFGPFERMVYKLTGANSTENMNWSQYSLSILFFNFFGLLLLLLILLYQHFLPLNPQNISGMDFWLALNTAISFVTNTNWQAYSGEVSLSYFSQMVGLTVQNFLSAATGICVLMALVRGLRQKENPQLGNFWVDLTRTTIYILLPLSMILTLMLVQQGVIQNFNPYVQVATLEGQHQIIPMGPAASQIAIKQLGTNGGGFFGVNSAHPFENPTPISNFLQCISILLIPAALVYAFGVMLGNKKHGWALLFSMGLLFLGGLAISLHSEFSSANSFLPGAIMEGKEVRFGVLDSVLWSTATTVASNGSVNSMHSSLSPLTGLVALANMLTGEVIFGGVGSGLYGMIMYVIVTVFISGLMVGRTPEYLGKRIEASEVKWALVAILVPSVLLLLGHGLAITSDWGISSLSHQGPHGLSELLYNFASAVGNNGSAFGGFNANTPVFNALFGFCMLVGRYIVIFPVLKIAGSLSLKKSVPPTAGTFPTDGILFVVLLISVIVIVGALTFFPALSLGPLVEHVLLRAGIVF